MSNSEGRRLEVGETEWLGQGELDAKLCHAHRHNRLDNSSARLLSSLPPPSLSFSRSPSLVFSIARLYSGSFFIFSGSSLPLFIYSLSSSSILLVLPVLPRLRTFPLTSPSSYHLLYLVPSHSISLLSFLNGPYLRYFLPRFFCILLSIVSFTFS